MEAEAQVRVNPADTAVYESLDVVLVAEGDLKGLVLGQESY